MNKLLRFASSLVVLFVAVAGFGQSAPEYQLQGNRLVHKGDGGYEVSVARSLRYLGVKRFHIRDAADAEQHIFVEADAQGHVRRLVWVQFEQQLPGQKWQYDYPSPDRMKLGELEFITDSRAFRRYTADDATSDHAMVDRQLAEHKLTWDAPIIGLRMVHLPDKERRRELMIIYVETLPKAEEAKFSENESDAGRWPKELAKVRANAARDVSARLKH